MEKTRKALAEMKRPTTLFVLLAVLALFAPLAETKFLPVTTDTHLLEFNQTFENGKLRTIIKAEALKHRTCVFDGVEWFLGSRDSGQGQMEFAEFRDRPQLRGEGKLEWDILVVGLTREQIETNSYANVFHKCFGIPFLTKLLPEWFPRHRTKTHFWN